MVVQLAFREIVSGFEFGAAPAALDVARTRAAPRGVVEAAVGLGGQEVEKRASAVPRARLLRNQQDKGPQG